MKIVVDRYLFFFSNLRQEILRREFYLLNEMYRIKKSQGCLRKPQVHVQRLHMK